MRKRTIFGVLAGLLVLVCVGAGAAFLFKGTQEVPNPVEQKPEERLQYVMSNDFRSLPVEKKKEYMKESMKNGPSREVMRKIHELPETERKKLREVMGPVFHSMMKERVDKFFELNTAEEKTAYLDKCIEEHEKRREQMRNGRQNMTEEERKEAEKRRQDGGRGRRGPPSLDRIKEHIDRVTPEERARMTQFHLAMRARMKATGKAERGPGGPRAH